MTDSRESSERSNGRALKIGIIGVTILLVSVFHFGTSTDYRYLHEIYQRVYYIPILLAAFWFGPMFGFLTALAVSLIYMVHIQLDWAHFPVYTFNQYAEIFLYHVVALIIGFLSDRERRQRKKLEVTSRELAEAYSRLQDTFEQLRNADRLAALGQLSAGIAHEIRNPLASVKGSVEIIETEIPEGHPKREFVEIIREEMARLNGIVTEFLRFARPPRPSIERTSVNEIIEASLRLIQSEAENAGVRIERDLDKEIAPTNVDPSQIRQVFLNVLLNGIQAMPDGGVLSVRSRSRDASIFVEVSDTGVGLSEEHLQQVFDPFFSTKESGTGMGLSISYQLVQSHGGEIRVHRNRKSGLTFGIELPR